MKQTVQNEFTKSTARLEVVVLEEKLGLAREEFSESDMLQLVEKELQDITTELALLTDPNFDLDQLSDKLLAIEDSLRAPVGDAKQLSA